MRILLLGVTGLLGHNVLEVLLSKGYLVTLLLRSPQKLLISHPNINVVKGELSFENISRAVQDCNAIINCAGTTDMSLLYQEQYYPVNRDLCGILSQIMREHSHVESVVHVSTANTIGYGSPESMATEESPMKGPFLQSFYAISKLQGEEILLSVAKELPNKHIVIVNPGFMIGGYDVKPSSGVLLLSGYKRPLMVAPKGGKSFVHVQDVAHAVVNGLKMGHSGTRYLATGENLSLKSFYALQSQIMGYNQHIVTLPNWIVSIAGRVGDLIRKMGIAIQLSTRNVNQLMVMEYYDCALARKDLQMPHTDISIAIKDFFTYWHTCSSKKNVRKQ